MSKWYVRSSATCWVVSSSEVELTFPTKKLAQEYADFKNSQRGKASEPK